MPCKPQKARKLLKSGKAEIYKYTPFTIKLKYGSTGYKQLTTLGIDAGSVHIGASATTERRRYMLQKLLCVLVMVNKVQLICQLHAEN